MAEKKVDAKVESKKEKKDSKSGSKAKVGFFSKTAKFLRECKGELKKITWPTPKATTKNFLVVLAVIAVMGVFIFALDQGLYALLNLVMETAAT